MTFAALIETFEAGFALDRLDELRVAAAGVVTTKAQRKQQHPGLMMLVLAGVRGRSPI
jgi:hypothetical protein